MCFPRSRAKAIMAYCAAKPGFWKRLDRAGSAVVLSHLLALRYDKYENKTLYWHEQEMEAEFEKRYSRTTRQTTGYTTETDASTAFQDHLAPLEFGPPTDDGREY